MLHIMPRRCTLCVVAAIGKMLELLFDTFCKAFDVSTCVKQFILVTSGYQNARNVAV